MHNDKLKAGDEITLSISPQVWISKYASLRPTVTVKRMLGAFPQRDVEEMDQALRELAMRKVLDELALVNEFTEVHAKGGDAGLIRYLQEQIHGTPSTQARPSGPRRAAPGK